MTTLYEIPLINLAQTLSITLADVSYVLTVKWNDASSCWVMDMGDANGNPILQGIPLVTGSDLLEQFAYLNFGGALIAQTDHDIYAPPTYDNLGTTGHLYFETPD